jgi:hypothetical protein
MRKTLFASAAALGLAMCLPGAAPTALAQSSGGTDTSGGTESTAPAKPAAPAATPGSDQMGQTGGGSSGMSQQGNQAEMSQPAPATHMASARSSTILAPLPSVGLGANATPQEYLQAAQQALQQRQGGRAENALARAETRLLSRATPASEASQPSGSTLIQQIAMARNAAHKRQWNDAQQALNQAMNNPELAQAGGMGGSMGAGGGMKSGTVGGAPAGNTMPMPSGQGGAPAAPPSQGGGTQ